MSNDSKKPRLTEEKKLKKIDLVALRAAHYEREQSLHSIKSSLGCGAVSLDEFLTMVPGTDMEQSETSKLFDLQSDFQQLQYDRAILWAEDNVIEELNRTHAIIQYPEFIIIKEFIATKSGLKDFLVLTKRSLIDIYQNKRVLCSDGKERSKAQIWLAAANRREYESIDFDPSTIGSTGHCFNIWQGFSKEPMPGNCTLFWNHVHDNICSGNEQAYLYVRKWLAYIFQYPAEVHTALVILGLQGTGKNVFVDAVGTLFGRHYLKLSGLHELLSPFNAHLKYGVLVNANEALWGGNKKDIGQIKALITDPTWYMQGKGRDSIALPNYRHIIITTNDDWPVHVDSDDRRFFILRVSNAHKEDHAYFAAIKKQLETGGYEALLYDLLHEDVDNFNPCLLPVSGEAFEMKLRSADSAHMYIYETLREGGVLMGKNLGAGFWHDAILKTELYQDYSTWCMTNGHKSIQQNQFGKTP